MQSAAQLRVMMRRWRLRASLRLRLWAALQWRASLLAGNSIAHGFGWLLSMLGVLSAAIEVSADVSAYFNAKRRVAEIERNLRAQQAPETAVAGEETHGD